MKPKNENTSQYPEYSGLHFPSMEKNVLSFWKQNKIFQLSISERSSDKSFVFYEGPPSANGMPGIHHVMSRTLKDIFCRYKTLQGYRVDRKAGWDTHGLPVELGVEKELGITKNDIGTTISIEDYNEYCKKNVLKFTDKWNELTEKMGYWVDLDDPYITYNNSYIETLWSLLRMLYDKDLLYKGYTIQPYSPAAGTGLSSHEINQPGCYRNVKDVSAIAQFKVTKNSDSDFLFETENEDVRILAWTTTPWTLPSNTALAVGENIDYSLVKTFNPYTYEVVNVVLAKDLIEKYFPQKNAELSFADYKAGDKAIPFTIIKSFKGKELLSVRYEQLLPYVTPEGGDAFKVISGDFVTTSDGTGIVHIAPSFGADDMRVGKQNGMAALTLVNKEGKFLDSVSDPQFGLGGEFIKEAYLTEDEKSEELKNQKELLKPIIPNLEKYLSVDDRIVLKLKLENKLFKTEKYEHNYPHCWRTDKPIIYYPLDSWFVRITAVKDRMIELNKTINWKPSHTGEGRFGQWLENLVDWNLSRSRYWGTPLPIWRTEDKAEEICIGSVNELENEIKKSVAAGFMTGSERYRNDNGEIELHKPFVDNIILVSPLGKKMFREADLIDVWFDSGAMPYAQWNWTPDKVNQDPFGKNPKFPADYIAEGVDQTRGWFYTLHAIGVALFDSVAYKNVISNGLLLDKNGNKMSKRLGNIVDPFETIEKFGADPTRWYMTRNSDPWDNLKFDTNGISEVTRSIFGTLYNTYSFFALYANLDKFLVDKNNPIEVSERTELDRWIISKLHSLIQEVNSCFEDYEPTKAARAIEEFVDVNLSNWYIRLSRRRFWKGEMSPDKQAAYEALHECLETVAQLMSPIAPFFSEWLFTSLHPLKTNESASASSVHLTLMFPSVETNIDKALEQRMEMAQDISSMILSLRKKEMIKVRQPLQKILIPVSSEEQKKQLEQVESYILNEVNVKEISYVSDASDIVKKKIKPNFKTLGKKAGAKIKQVQEAIGLLSQADIALIENQKVLSLKLIDDSFELEIEDVEISSEDIEGWLVASKNGLTVALDVTLTEDLLKEGVAREFINKIQNIRKESGFQVLDRVVVKVIKNEALESALKDFYNYISNEILSNEIILVDQLDSYHEVEFNETTLKLSISVV
jgi:isoleucyl-tRNA synthetase